ncbi:MAG: hypothetical protein ACE5R4_15825 [Armatimonadota bacterium]
MPWEDIGIWVGAALTLAIFSFLYRDNVVYKAAEHIFVGVSAGYWLSRLYHDAVLPDLIFPLFRPEDVGLPGPNYVVIVPGLLGVLMLARFVPGGFWLSRWPIAFVVGVGSGTAIPVTVQAFLLDQVGATIVPVVAHQPVEAGGGIAWATSVGNCLLIIGTLTTLAYFYFSRPHVGAFGGVTRVGIWFLMFAFGASFGYTVMARQSLLIGRVEFLIFDWIRPTLASLGVG